MRKEIFVALCVIGLLVGVATLASATTVSWTIMQDPSMAGHGPGADLLLGTTDSTSGQNNSCNLSGAADCTGGGTPGTGSWSYIALELPQATSCNGGTDPGKGGCTTNDSCGSGGICLTCPEVAGGPPNYDTFSYMGAIGCPLGNGTMKACEENGVFKWTELKIGASESVAAGLGGTSINLNPVGSTSGYASGCGTGVDWTSQANIGFWVGCVPNVVGGKINGLNLNGRVYATGGTNSASNCGYNSTQINALRATALGKGAAYMLVMCGDTTIPNDTTTTSACLRGASVHNVLVATTTSTGVDTCTDPNPGCVAPASCAGGVEEAAE
jgi:hypothetical protein